MISGATRSRLVLFDYVIKSGATKRRLRNSRLQVKARGHVGFFFAAETMDRSGLQFKRTRLKQ